MATSPGVPRATALTARSGDHYLGTFYRGSLLRGSHDVFKWSDKGKGRARLELFGQAVRASVERQVALERAFFDDLSEQLELTAEQKSQIETIVGPLFVQKLQGNQNTAERARAFAQIRTILRPAQRQKLVQIVIESWKPAGE